MLAYLRKPSPFLRLLDDKMCYEYGPGEQVEAIMAISEVDLVPQDVPGENERNHQLLQSGLEASEI
jgi:hypothetical protein